MRKRVVLVALTLLTGVVMPPPAVAGPSAPDVYAYLENPEMIGEGQEPHHAFLRPYASTASAARGEERGPYVRSLNGRWRIAMSDLPEQVPAGFQADGYDTSGWREVNVPHTWQTDGLDHPIFRNIATEIQPDDPPRVPRDVNPTAAYTRDFTVPADWTRRATFLRFEGVTSGYFVWVNGRYIGYDQGGYTPAEFDISAALRPGHNRLAVQVHRWTAGAYLEDYDQWRYAGIFRDVNLYTTPATYVRDVSLRTDLDATYTDATLTAAVELDHKAGGTTGKHRVTASLRDARGREVGRTSTDVDVTGPTTTQLTMPVRDPAKWTDETPNLYTVVFTLTSPDGRVMHTTSESVGFREIEIRDRVLLVNGKRVLFKGVNRAETDPTHGRHVPRSAQERDVALMERLNVNAVRTSHYPSDPYFYDLADRHGLWIDDEVDIETHNHENCARWCQANQPEWRAAFLDRLVAMVERDKNHPSVFMWDTGNEAGLGAHHFAMADWLDANEPTRPVYHQSNNPDGDAPFADVWGPRYPSPERFAQQAESTTKPLIFGEYAHAMGNSLGNFREFWDIIRAHPQTQGGFIWDWAEQSIDQPLRIAPDSSGNGISAHLSGAPSLVDGHRGKGLYLSGLDDFVEVYRDRRLDLTGTAVTLDAWVKPAAWSGDFRIVGKGDHQYALKMKTQDTLEFFIFSGGTWRFVQAKVPADFYGNWHRVSGTYDGSALRLYIDGREVGNLAYSGVIATSSAEVNIGRDFETSWNDPSSVGRMAHGVIDDVRIYDRALSPAELAVDRAPAGNAVLALDFDRIVERGDYLAYGSSLSGLDGLVGADRHLQPETTQLAWVQQPLRFSYADGTLSVGNERQFTGTDDLRLRWRVTEGSTVVARGEQPLRVAAGSTGTVAIRVPGNPRDRERFLTVEAVTVGGDPMLPRGHVLAHDQFALDGARVPGLDAPRQGRVTTSETDAAVVASVGDARYTVDKKSGTLSSIVVRGKELLAGGPELDAWRAPISNETFAWGRAEGEDWRRVGLDRLATTVTGVTVTPVPSGVRVAVTSRVAAPDVANAWFDQTMTYTIDGSGTVQLGHTVTPQGDVRTLTYLPRIGVQLAVPSSYDRFAWYGRKAESYVDRREGSPIGVYRSTVREQYTPYYRPQDHGNHTDARWALLTDGRTGGLLVSGAKDVSVTRFDDLDRAAYPFQLRPNDGWHTLHASYAVTGVGDTPNPVREHYQVQQDQTYEYTLTLRPLTAAEARAGLPAGA